MKTRNNSRPNVIAHEDGASMILLALVLVLLMGFAAIAVDAAAAWALRRQGQSGADTGVIAGAIFTADRDSGAAMLAAENEIIRITNSTINPDMGATDWRTEWDSCVDTNKPTEFTQTLNYDCISFNDNLSKIRVRTPDVPWRTTFARVIGFDQVDTFAEAEVETVYQATGGVMPFGLPGAAANDAEICLKTGANPKNGGTCDGPDTGNFGFIDFSQFGNDRLGTPTQCTGGGTDRLARNIAQGVDHPLGTTADPLAELRRDRDACTPPQNFNARPYHVDTQTGNIAQVLYDGFVEGVDGLPGRLDRGTNQVDIGTGSGEVSLDNTPLWVYLIGDQTVCVGITSHDDLVGEGGCLHPDSGNYTDGVWTAGPIFEDTILEAPRFGWVPLFHEDDLAPGTSNRTIKEFRPVYIQTTLWGCNNNGCTTYWDPGEDLVGDEPGKNDKIEAATAINLPIQMFRTKVADTEPGTDNVVEYLLSK